MLDSWGGTGLHCEMTDKTARYVVLTMSPECVTLYQRPFSCIFFARPSQIPGCCRPIPSLRDAQRRFPAGNIPPHFLDVIRPDLLRYPYLLQKALHMFPPQSPKIQSQSMTEYLDLDLQLPDSWSDSDSEKPLVVHPSVHKSTSLEIGTNARCIGG